MKSKCNITVRPPADSPVTMKSVAPVSPADAKLSKDVCAAEVDLAAIANFNRAVHIATSAAAIAIERPNLIPVVHVRVDVSLGQSPSKNVPFELPT